MRFDTLVSANRVDGYPAVTVHRANAMPRSAPSALHSRRKHFCEESGPDRARLFLRWGASTRGARCVMPDGVCVFGRTKRVRVVARFGRVGGWCSGGAARHSLRSPGERCRRRGTKEAVTPWGRKRTPYARTRGCRTRGRDGLFRCRIRPACRSATSCSAAGGQTTRSEN